MDYKKSNQRFKIASAFFIFVLSFSSLIGQSIDQRKDITSNYDAKKLATIISGFENEYNFSKHKLTQMSKANTIDLYTISKDGIYTQFNDFGTDGTPLFYTTFNTLSNTTQYTKKRYTREALDLGLDGLGMLVGVWDAGKALPSHQEFEGRALNADDNVTDVASHTTLVTGVIISSGIKEEAKGIASKATALNSDWIRDKIEVAEAAAQGLLLSNHSYGISSTTIPDWYFGSYLKLSEDWDKIMYNAPYYLMVTAAGNSQTRNDNSNPFFGKTEDGFDLLLGFNTSKNGLVVGAADIKTNDAGKVDEATVSGYSSFGPLDDGRIKPDLAGNGSLIYSTDSSNNQSYRDFIGTSMAAPGITGSLLLLQEYYLELYGTYMKASTLKGLALHTATDVQEQGPDYKMGWGVLNTKKATQILTNRDHTTIVTEEELNNETTTYTIKVKAEESMPLMASISWTDPDGGYTNGGDLNNPTAALVNDLDIRITKDDETYYPWKMSAANANSPAFKGDNLVDPFERIEIADAEGEYTITVTHKGILTNEIQNFSLIVSGIALTACKTEVPKNSKLDRADENSTFWSWDNVEETLYEVQFKIENATDWNTELTWENSMQLTELEIGVRYQFRIRAVCTENAISEFSEIINFVFEGEATKIEEATTVDLKEEQAIKVFPSPASSEITIQGVISQEATYSIRTISGIQVNKGLVENKINVSNLKSGLYIITVKDNTSTRSTKFFKN